MCVWCTSAPSVPVRVRDINLMTTCGCPIRAILLVAIAVPALYSHPTYVARRPFAMCKVVVVALECYRTPVDSMDYIFCDNYDNIFQEMVLLSCCLYYQEYTGIIGTGA